MDDKEKTLCNKKSCTMHCFIDKLGVQVAEWNAKQKSIKCYIYIYIIFGVYTYVYIFCFSSLPVDASHAAADSALIPGPRRLSVMTNKFAKKLIGHLFTSLDQFSWQHSVIALHANDISAKGRCKAFAHGWLVLF